MKKTALILALILALSCVGFAAAEGSDRMTITVMGIDWGYGPSPNSSMEQYWEDMFDVNLDIQWVNYNDYNEEKGNDKEEIMPKH